MNNTLDDMEILYPSLNATMNATTLEDVDPCMISMTLNYNTIGACFFADTPVSSTTAFAGACFVAFFAALFLELLRRFVQEFDEWLIQRDNKAKQRATTTNTTTNTPAEKAPAARPGAGAGQTVPGQAVLGSNTSDTRGRAGSGGVLNVDGNSGPVRVVGAEANAPGAARALGPAGVLGPARAAEQNEQADLTHFRPAWMWQIVRAVLHTAQFVVAFFLMLFAMYFNVYVLTCIALGILFGSFGFQFTRKWYVGDRTRNGHLPA